MSESSGQQPSERKSLFKSKTVLFGALQVVLLLVTAVLNSQGLLTQLEDKWPLVVCVLLGIQSAATFYLRGVTDKPLDTQQLSEFLKKLLGGAGVLLLLFAIGCQPHERYAPCDCPMDHVELSQAFGIDGQALPAGYQEVPTMGLPAELRQKNWTVGGSGSCVHASTVNLFTWHGMPEMAAWWRQNHGAGEYSTRLGRKLDAAGIRHAYTDSGSIEFLEWCIRTRRGAGIGYYPRHAINLVHLDSERAGLVDNNRPNQVIWVDRNEFLRNWQHRYGGWAWTLVYAPSPPLPWI